MFCPMCGKKVVQEDWRCEKCGADVRRVIREEFWDELKGRFEKEEIAPRRFDYEEQHSIKMEGWRSLHAHKRKPLIIVGAGSGILAVLILTLFFAFRSETDSQQNEVSETPAAAESLPQTPTTAQPRPQPPPVVITSEEVKARIEEWRKAWEQTAKTKSVDDYGAFYSTDFQYKSSGKNKKDFLASRLKEAGSAAIIIIENGEPQIRIEADKAFVSFNQQYLSDRFSDAGTKSLTLVKRGSRLLIISEDFTDQTPAAQVNLEELKARVLAWRKAWEEIAIKGNLGNLPGYYHPDFKGPKGATLEAYLNDKLELAKQNPVITIDIKDIRLSALGDRAAVSFRQAYHSTTYSADGTKILIFKLQDGKPLITFEGFRLAKKLPQLQVEDFWGQ